MEKRLSNPIARALNKLYGGLNMSWLFIILYAVGTAALSALFLIIPIFRNTSFIRVGETFEAWIFFAVIIMANCKKPLESAIKTFVFFLISQPLIYLFQVPFSWQGWGLFGYYKYWLIWTLFTFPMAFVGWYIKKKNWLSLLILLPVLFILTEYYVGGFMNAVADFPHHILLAAFCFAQVAIYLVMFTSNIWQKLIGFLLPIAIALVMSMSSPEIELNGTHFLPNDPVLSEEATVSVDDAGMASAYVESAGTDSMIRIKAFKLGTTVLTITDGDSVYRYSLEIYKDEGNHAQVKLTQLD